MSWYDLPSPSLATSGHLWPPLTPSASTLPLLPLLHSNSKAYLCNLYNYIAPTLRLTMDQYQTHLDLVPFQGPPSRYPFYLCLILPIPFHFKLWVNSLSLFNSLLPLTFPL